MKIKKYTYNTWIGNLSNTMYYVLMAGSAVNNGINISNQKQ